MSAEEIEVRSTHKPAPLAVMVPKNDGDIEVSDGDDLGSTDQQQTDDCEEFQGRVQTIVEGIGKTYSSLGEDLPRLPAYNPSFNMVETLCIGLVKEAQTLLESAQYRDEETARLIQLASESQTIQYPPARKIGLIGDSAAGKSTLVNALLDSPGLALEGATGQAATCVITEYKNAWPGQKTPYMAEIKFYGLDKIRTIIQHEFGAYYNYTIVDIQKADQETQEELSACQETALETFKALFADRHEFRNEKAIEKFFSTAKSAEDKDVLHILHEWVEMTMIKYGADEGLLCLNAYTGEELANKIEPFANTCTDVDDKGRQTPSLWPLVEIVRIGLQSRLLKESLVIADLPGLSDVNKTRRKTTTEYIRNCEAALLVAPIARVETDIQVHKRLGQYHRMFGNKKAMVVTKTDETHGLSKPNGLEPSPEAAKEYKRLDSASKFASKNISRLNNLRTSTRGKDKETLTQEISKLQLERKALNVLNRQALVIMRNEKTSRGIRRKYKTITSDPLPLPFFAVSSVDYNAQARGFMAEEEFPLPVDTTGIPALRRHCYQFPAKSRLDALTHYREGILTELISSLNMWSSQYKVQRRSALKKVVTKPSTGAQAIIATCVNEIGGLVESCVLEKSSKFQGSWVEHNKEKFKEWAEWHPRTFAAFCRHDGIYETGAQSFRNWNAEMLEPVVSGMTVLWGNLDEALTTCKEKCNSALIQLIETIRSDLNDIAGVAAEPMLPFLASLTAKKALVRKEVESFFDQIKSTIRTAKLNVHMIDEDPDCFLMRAMTPIYAKCGRITTKSGHRNLHTARCTLLEDAISKGEQFSTINPGIKKTVANALEKQEPKFVQNVQKIFDKVVQDFDLMFVVEELPNPNRDVLRREVQRFVRHANAQIDGPIELEFAKATKDSA